MFATVMFGTGMRETVMFEAFMFETVMIETGMSETVISNAFGSCQLLHFVSKHCAFIVPVFSIYILYIYVVTMSLRLYCAFIVHIGPLLSSC